MFLYKFQKYYNLYFILLLSLWIYIIIILNGLQQTCNDYSPERLRLSHIKDKFQVNYNDKNK